MTAYPYRAVARSGARTAPHFTFLFLATGATAFSLLQSLLIPVMGMIQHEMEVSRNTVAWILIAWMLSASVATPLMGRFGDMIGKKRTLVAALVSIAIGSVLGAVAPNFAILVVARVLQGIGGAIFPLAFGIIRDEFPPRQVPTAVGAMSAVIAAGGGLGLVLAGPVVDLLGWRWLFWVPAVVTAMTAMITFFFVPESPAPSGGRINWLAASLLSGWLVGLLLAISQGHVWGWTSLPVLGLSAAAVVLAVAWIVVEARSSNPLIDMKMMRRPAVWTSNLVTLLFGASMYSSFSYLPLFTQTPASAGYGFGATISQSGLIMLPLVLGMTITGFISGPLDRFVPSKLQLVIGAAVSALTWGAFVLVHGTAWQVSLEAGIFGLGLGMAYSAITTVIVSAVPPSQTGVASGMNANIRSIGGAVGAAVASTIITADLQPGGLPFERGYVNAFIAISAAAAAAALVALFIPHRHHGRE